MVANDLIDSSENFLIQQSLYLLSCLSVCMATKPFICVNVVYFWHKFLSLLPLFRPFFSSKHITFVKNASFMKSPSYVFLKDTGDNVKYCTIYCRRKYISLCLCLTPLSKPFFQPSRMEQHIFHDARKRFFMTQNGKLISWHFQFEVVRTVNNPINRSINHNFSAFINFPSINFHSCWTTIQILSFNQQIMTRRSHSLQAKLFSIEFCVNHRQRCH